jgi:ubiquinone/menaquinone biosynthesis C-methylase UbiE
MKKEKINYKVEARKTYNAIARDYHFYRTKKYPRGWFYNEMLEMPTTLKILGNVKGKKILDIGCGTGIYAKILSRKGARVCGIDISEEMIKIAKKENPKIEFKIGDIEKLPYKNKEFDIILAALVLEYLPSWDRSLKEVRRVLKKNGIFVFSMGNPVINALKKVRYKRRKFRVVSDYFNEGFRIETWRFNKMKVDIKGYHQTYGTIIKAIIKNGFEVIDYEDAFPVKKAEKLFPKDYKLWSNMPYFCTWKIRKIKNP